MISEKIKKEIADICDEFVDRVCDISEISPYKGVRHSHSGFPIFEIANKEFYEYSYYERYIEATIRDDVIKPIMRVLFREIAIDIEWPDRNSIYVHFSNERIEQIQPFEFYIKEGESFIGVRYTGMSEEDYDFEETLLQHEIGRVLIIRWEENCKYRHESERIKEVTAREFFETYFDSEEADYVIEEIRNSVKRANDAVGFQTIPMLSLRNLSSFKDNRSAYFSALNYEKINYQIVKDSQISNWKDYSLPQEDAKILKEFFVSNDLFKVFDGRKEFSRSFMTSEYLFSIFKEGNSLDYTAVATGYLKSVEQLLYEIVRAELQLRPSEKVLIKRKTGKLKNYKYVKTSSIIKPGTDTWHVPFLPRNEKYFDIAMVPLIWLLHDHEDIWRISGAGKEMVHNVLLKYSQECRNDHFHKDNIDSFQSVRCIRNNTILMFYLLIGGCKLANKKEKTEELLGIDKEVFSELCKKLYRIPSSQNRYIFKYGDVEKKVIRLYDQQRPIYDSDGSLRDTIIEFVQVDDYRIDDYQNFLVEIGDEQRVHLSRETVPDKIWLILRNGERREVL